MSNFKGVRVELIKGYVLGKSEYGRVFPGFFDAVAERVETVLRPNYPGIDPVVGPRDAVRAMSLFPELSTDVPLDWVAFGFGGVDMYDYHIGVVLQMTAWPVEYTIGLHIMDRLWDLARGEVETINWTECVGLAPNEVYAEAVREHRWLDPVRELEFADLDNEVERIADRVVKYYWAAAQAAAAVRAKLQAQD